MAPALQFSLRLSIRRLWWWIAAQSAVNLAADAFGIPEGLRLSVCILLGLTILTAHWAEAPVLPFREWFAREWRRL